MKLAFYIPSLVLLGVASSSSVGDHQAAVLQHHQHILGRSMLSSKFRMLQLDCSLVAPFVETFLSELYGVGFDCDCSSTTVSCSSKGETCCDETCFTIQQSAVFSSSGTPVSETSCTTFTGDSVLGEPTLAGSRRCIEAQYCGMKLCSCAATLDGNDCAACSICEDLPVAPELQLTTADCSNIAGGEAISFQCEDFDTIEVRHFVASRHLLCFLYTERSNQRSYFFHIRRLRSLL